MAEPMRPQYRVRDDVPVPQTVSPEAQAVIAMGTLRPPQDYPALGDLEGWRAHAKADNELVLSSVASVMEGSEDEVEVEDLDLGPFLVYVATPRDLDPADRRVYLEFHGGAWLVGGGAVCRMLTPRTTLTMQSRVWGVDYRQGPDHPFPTPVDDCLAAYRRLLEDRRPEEIVVGGMSAGGNLAAAVMLRARDEGLPMPAAVNLETAVVDIGALGDTWWTNQGLDPLLNGDHLPVNLLYANGEDLRNPYLSPVYGDLRGFPPTILTTGTRDLVLSDTCRMHRALLGAGVTAELHVWEAAGHGLFLQAAPEDAEKAAQIRSFVNRFWEAGPAGAR